VFLPNSRYYQQKVVDSVAADGRPVKAVSLRRLASPPGEPRSVKGNDRLDIMAQRQYDDATMFWHIADANTELRADELVRVPGRVIEAPDK